jgi:hypothetical protein
MEVARYWRTTDQRYRLTGEVDLKTGQTHVSRRGGRNAEPKQLSGRGEVYSFTTIHAPPAGFEKFAPYLVALVRLDEGPMVTAQLTDVDEAEAKIGMKVEMVTRVLREDGDDGRGILVYGYKFRPLWGMRDDELKAQAVAVPQPVANGNGYHANGNGKHAPDLAMTV